MDKSGEDELVDGVAAASRELTKYLCATAFYYPPSLRLSEIDNMLDALRLDIVTCLRKLEEIENRAGREL